jgi:beta-lactamase regulating signal transducer with metallopeptidase domain
MINWMLYVVLVSALLAIAALLAEHRARLRGTASRWFWIIAIIASLLIPTVIASVSVQLPNVFNSSVSQKIVVLREATALRLPPLILHGNSAVRAHDAFNNDAALKRSWVVVSTIMLLALIVSGAHLFWRKRRWTPGTLSQTTVLVTDDVGPAVVGLLRPRIVVPGWLLQAPLAQQRAVMAHEQAHLDAGDPQLLTIALCLLVFMPWNLPLWWQLRRLRYAIEVDCDARVLKSGHEVTHYGETLIAVCERQSGYIGAVAAMSESKSFLEERIKIMIRKPTTSWRVTATLLGCLSIGLVAAAAQISPPNAGTSINLPAEIALDAATLDGYVGSYQFGEHGVFEITRKDQHLFAQLTGQPAFEIYAQNSTEFFYKVVNAQITFIVDAQHQTTALVLHQNGANITAQRIDAAVASQVRSATATKVQSQASSPGSEAALRHLIAGLSTGKPNYDEMSPELATATRQQLSSLQTSLTYFGAVQSIEFRGVGTMGEDVYEVKHEHGLSRWRITLSSSGIITGALVTPGP